MSKHEKHDTKGGYEAHTIVIYKPRGAKRPEHLLAEASLRFNAGLLKGATLVGFALWRAEGQDGPFISVTVPSREGEDRWYEFLHGDLSTLRRSIRRAYSNWLTSQSGMDAAKAFLAEVARRAQDDPREQVAEPAATLF